MNKTLKKYFIILSTFLILVMGTLLTYTFYKQFQKNIFSELKDVSLIVEKLDQTSLSLIDNFRITLLDMQGVVVFDNIVDSAKMDNHIERPEIDEAIRQKEGRSIRYSTTLNADVYYYAVTIDDYVLRVSKEAKTISKVFIQVLPWISLIIAFVGLLTYFIIKRLTSLIIAPLQNISYEIEETNDNVYDEIVPIIRTIQRQSDQLAKQDEVIQSSQKQINMIIRNIQEGLIFLDEYKNIIMVNNSAMKLLNVQEHDYLNKSFLYLSRDKNYIQIIDSIKQNEKKKCEFSLYDKRLHLYLNSVSVEDNFVGYIGILTDISKEYENALLRQEFSANVSHELKTPLTSILGYSELIENKMVNASDINMISGKISKEAKRLLALINDIIELSKLDELQDAIKEDVNLYEVCLDVKERIKLTLEKQKIFFSLDGAAMIIRGNHKMLDELVYNLVDNAIKYNKETGTIWLKLIEADGVYKLSVKDNGIGISEYDQMHMFERFYRSDKSRSNNGSSGLGLAIVKHIALLHNASIKVESELEIGTTITINFLKNI